MTNEGKIDLPFSHFEDLMNNRMKQDLTEKSKSCFNTNPEKMIEDLIKKNKRYNNIMVLQCNYLPDECYGILYLRPEDICGLDKIKKEIGESVIEGELNEAQKNILDNGDKFDCPIEEIQKELESSKVKI